MGESHSDCSWFRNWESSLPDQLKRWQELRCVYCGAPKEGHGAVLAPACSKKECREKASAEFADLTFQQLCVVRGKAMGYEDKEIGDLMESCQPGVGKKGITTDGVKQHVAAITHKLKLGKYTKSTVLVAWYIAQAMELEYASRPSKKPGVVPKSAAGPRSTTPKRTAPPKPTNPKRVRGQETG